MNVPCESGIRYAGNAQSQADTIQDVGNVLSYSFTYKAVHIFIQVTSMYVHVYPYNMECLAGQLVVCASTSIFSSSPESSLLESCSLSLPDGPHSPPKWLEYVYRTAHPVLRWLPTKLAKWIGENLQDELGFPDKADQRAQPGSGWTPAELNYILQSHVVDGALTTFGCVEWESELCRGVMSAR